MAELSADYLFVRLNFGFLRIKYFLMKNHSLICPTETDFLSENYDVASEEAPSKTLIICSAPRSGSNELCRFLLAAGLGIPFEYFNPVFIPVLAQRWQALGSEPNSIDIEAYINALRVKRSANGVLAVKVQYSDFERFLRNRAGEALFDGALVIYLFRPDAVAQFESFYVANETGRWDYTEARTTAPKQLSNLSPVQIRDLMEAVLMDDGRLRILFTMLGIRPFFLSMDDLFAEPKLAVNRIAQAFGSPLNEERLDEAIAVSKRYSRASRNGNCSDSIRDLFKPIVFRR